MSSMLWSQAVVYTFLKLIAITKENDLKTQKVRSVIIAGHFPDDVANAMPKCVHLISV